jgi:hypothetical protein
MYTPYNGTREKPRTHLNQVKSAGARAAMMARSRHEEELQVPPDALPGDMEGRGPPSPGEQEYGHPAHEQGEGGEHERSTQDGTGTYLVTGIPAHEQDGDDGEYGLRQGRAHRCQDAANTALGELDRFPIIPHMVTVADSRMKQKLRQNIRGPRLLLP